MVARLHLALDAASKRGEIDYVYSESTANTCKGDEREFCGVQLVVYAFGISKEAEK